MAELKRGVVQAFNATEYKATVQVAGSPLGWLEGGLWPATSPPPRWWRGVTALCLSSTWLTPETWWWRCGDEAYRFYLGIWSILKMKKHNHLYLLM